jgi:oligopeptide transport system substrate-binding protein
MSSNRLLPILMGFVVVLILAVGVAFVVVLAGGGGNDDGGSPSGPTNDNGDDGGDGNDGGVSAEGFCEASHLITFGGDPATILDPIQVRDEGTSEYVVEIFGGLVTLDLNLEVQGDIADSWDVSPDGLVYTFHIRDGVVFQNNRRVTADDVKYSIERAADPANNSPTVLLYLGAIEGLRERFNNEASDVSGVQVIDESTIQITLNAPREWFISELTYPVAYVVDKNQIESDPRGWTRQPNGTGPYRLAEFSPAERIELVRNDNYHLGKPLLERVTFDLGGGSLATRYENDEIHIGAVPPAELQAVQAGSSDLSDEYHPQARMAVSYIAFNVDKAPFDDVNVRKALAMTVDRETINQLLFFDAWRVADGILPPEMPGYDESVASYEFNVDEAKRLIAESKYAGNMPRIILTYGGGAGDAPDTLVAIQDGWKQNLGIDVELQATDYSAFLRELRRGTFQLYSAGWAADYPDPEDFIDKLWASDSQQNEQGYDNPDVDALIMQARDETDRTRRFQLLNEAEQMILDDAAIIPTFWPVDHLLVKPCVKNWPEVSMTVPKYRYIEIDPNAR